MSSFKFYFLSWPGTLVAIRRHPQRNPSFAKICQRGRSYQRLHQDKGVADDLRFALSNWLADSHSIKSFSVTCSNPPLAAVFCAPVSISPASIDCIWKIGNRGRLQCVRVVRLPIGLAWDY